MHSTHSYAVLTPVPSVTPVFSGAAKGSPWQGSQAQEEVKEQQHGMQHQHTTMQMPLSEHATAPDSPLFGAGEVSWTGEGTSTELDSVLQGVYGAGEHPFPSLEHLLRSYFPSSPPLSIDDSPPPSAYSALPTPPPAATGAPDLDLLNELLTDNGLAAIAPSKAATPAPAPLDLSSFQLPQDDQLASPLFGTAGSPYELEYDANSPAYSPYAAASSVDATPNWGVVSPALINSSGFDLFASGASPEFGELSLSSTDTTNSPFNGFVPASNPAFDPYAFASTNSAAFLAGATSTGASHSAAATACFSPVVSPSQANIPDEQISPAQLPPPLPRINLALFPPAQSVAHPFADAAPAPGNESASSSPSLPDAADADGEDPAAAADDNNNDSDSDFLPSPPRESSVGPARSSRRVTTAARRSSAASPSSASASPAPAPVPAGLKVALDAPVTQRSYGVTSRTSAKRITKAMRKKMDAALARGEDVDEDAWVEETARKRAANTLSARQSRAKKAARMEELEGVEREFEKAQREWSEQKDALEREVRRLRKIVGEE
ncbi:hypothetical protein JCM10207_001573 [Rhodosporidiobolus poonsookiae]